MTTPGHIFLTSKYVGRDFLRKSKGGGGREGGEEKEEDENI